MNKHTCPVCGKEYDRIDMAFSHDCHGIPYRLLCLGCLEKIEDEIGYDGQYYTEADECYENPRKLEKQVEYWKKQREECLTSIHNLDGVGLTDMRTGYTSYDVLQDELEMIEENIAEYEQRANYAWQDEEFG